MAKGKSLEQIEAQMLKLQEKKRALHADLQTLAAERRKIILGDAHPSGGGVTVTPDPAIITAKTGQ